MNLIWIVADTFRADHLGCYGSSWVKTPNLDALAARSTVFEEHHAASFPTVPARADFLTGLWTFTYRSWEPMSLAERLLPEVLGEAGYRTVGVADTPFYTTNGFHLDRGFNTFTQLLSQIQETDFGQSQGQGNVLPFRRDTEFDYSAPQTMTLAEKYLEKIHDEPFFLLVDTWDPHEPWDPPAWYVKQYLPDFEGGAFQPPYDYLSGAGMTDRELEVGRASYAGMITMVDRWIGRLLDRVQTLGIADDTAIVFTSDHGFLVGEHDQCGKMIRRQIDPPIIDELGQPRDSLWARSVLYRELTHVPLIVHVPGTKPSRVDGLTSAVDIMPTVVELLTGKPAVGVHGRSLLPLVRGDADATGRDLVVTSVALQDSPGQPARLVDGLVREVWEHLPATITTADWTLVYAVPGEPVELYHMPTDPDQEHDVAPEHPDVVADLVARYISFLETAGTAAQYVDARRPLPATS